MYSSQQKYVSKQPYVYMYTYNSHSDDLLFCIYILFVDETGFLGPRDVCVCVCACACKFVCVCAYVHVCV